MRSSGKTALCLFLFAAFTIRSEAARLITRNAGEYLETSVLTITDDIVGCYLNTPRGEEIEFKPIDHSNDKYRLGIDTDFVKCQVTVKNLDSNDNGLWTIRSVAASGMERSESYQVTVLSEETKPETASTENMNMTEEPLKESTTAEEQNVETTLSELQENTTEPNVETSTPKIEVIDIDHTNIITTIGETHKLKIPAYDFLNTEKCYIVTPDGKQYNLESLDIYGIEVINDYNIACGVKVFIVSENLIGNWILISRGVRYSSEIVERRLPFTIILQDTETQTTIKENTITTEDSLHDPPSTEKETGERREVAEETIEKLQTVSTDSEDVNVINMDPGYFVTKIGEAHRVTIPKYDFMSNEKCYLVTPEGVKHDFEHLNIYGIEIINDYNVECGVNIQIVSEDMIGEWMLILRGTRYSIETIERRVPFTIVLEEVVNALPNEITIMEGKNIYLRLEASTPFYDTCKLIAPLNEDRLDVENDTRYVNTCGFIVNNASERDSGYWLISYGIKTIFKAAVRVNVYGGSDTPTESHYTWTLDRPVGELIGPENTVYCKVEDPNRNTVFDGFGRCNVTLPRVSQEHAGTWRMFVSVEGRVLTNEHVFHVSIKEAAPKPAVSTSVTTEKPIVTLTCSVSSSHPVRSCKFRDPSGRILLANPGVGEDRYSFHGSGASYSSGVHSHDCGIQITNPMTRDLGLWRCAMETENDTYYGFLSALCPWAMRDPEVAASVESEPTLKAESELVNGLVGESVTMACSVKSAIRYCYFRARNGTTYSVSPGESSGSIEYAGAGFDAGECSIRFSNLLATDTGRWSCHVGFTNPLENEQTALFQVTVQNQLAVEQKIEKNALIVTGRVHDDRAVEYCRFVRVDGLGFTTENLPEGYRSDSLLSVGFCEIRIPNPSVLELHPWTVAVRVRGQDVELSDQTPHSLQVPDSPDSEIEYIYRFPLVWILIIVIGLSLIVVGILVGPKRNRNWTYSRASSFRDSLRRSFTKKPTLEYDGDQKNTPMSA